MSKLPIEIMDRDMDRVLAAKSEAERLQIAWGMWRSDRDMITNFLKAESPELTSAEIQREVARRSSHGSW